jgi:hypothetical protein
MLSLAVLGVLEAWLSFAALMRTVRVEVAVRPAPVGGDVVDGVGGLAARVEQDVGHEPAIEEGLDTEVEVGLWAAIHRAWWIWAGPTRHR